MAFLPTNASQVQQFAVALYGIQVGSSTMAAVQADITAVGGLNNALNAYYAVSFGSKTTAQVAASVAANLGLTGAALTDGVAYITAALNAAPANARGAAIQGVLNLFASIPADNATYGAAAAAWNTKVAAAVSYTGAADAVAGSTISGTAFVLTTGVDSFVGGSGDDTFSGTLAAAASNPTFNAFDSVVGGAGTDTLNIASTTASNFTLPATFTVSGVENVNITQAASGGTGTGALTVANTTIGTGIKNFSYVDSSVAADMTAAAVSVTLNSAESVTTKAVGTGTFTTVAVTDTSTTASLTGSALKTVTIEKASGAATLTGNGITTVNLAKVAGLTTVTAAAGTRALTVNASSTTTQGGLTDAEATSVTLNITGAQAFGTLTTAKATSVAINATSTTDGASATLAAAKATSLALGGTALNTLTVTNTDPIAAIVVTGSGGVSTDVSSMTALTSIDTTGSTAVAPASGTITGANTFTIGTGTAYTGGAGEDKVSVGATTVAVNLGAGNDTATVSVTALGTGGSISGGDGTDTLKLANADAVTLSTAGTAQAAFKAAVTGFETLDITTQTGSTVDVSKMGTFSKVKFVSATAAQVLSGVTTGMNIESTYGAAGTSVTTNTLSGAADSLTFTMKGDLSTAARVFGTLATPGVETVNLITSDTSTTVTARLATLTVTDASATSIVISGNNGLALTHAGTALYNFDASGVTKGGVTFTAGALVTDTVVKGSASGGDTLDFSSDTAAVTLTAYAGTNTLKGSSAVASTITGGTGNDTITGGSGADTIVAGAGNTGNTITGAGGKDSIDLTNSTGSDVVRYDTIATSAAAAGAQMDTITGFRAGVDKINFAQGALSLTGVTTDGTGDAVATMAAAIDVSTSVASLADVYTALAAQTALTASAADGTATVAQVYNFTTGAYAGTYLVVNNATAGFQAATDVVIKLVGTSGTIAAGDFTFAA